ncbi:hypothetical protein BU16DRAFT_531124 [Lophium mytilinum]|uniref:Uncharacterized protein n=1 Tax=Lophium mytilinum TaxID=390894 RepID=A0A6A6QD53_9PEZI|nr:hypothetical protein BU16DRAFT_531124 [Lophium mytilinum]
MSNPFNFQPSADRGRGGRGGCGGRSGSGGFTAGHGGQGRGSRGGSSGVPTGLAAARPAPTCLTRGRSGYGFRDCRDKC